MPGSTAGAHLPYPIPDDSVDVPRDVKNLADSLDPLVTQGAVPPGMMGLWPGSVAPVGWAIMDGGTVASGPNPGLTALFGATGGFVTIPDMRNNFAVGAGTLALLATAGAASVALTVPNLPVHNHAVTDPGHNHTTVGAGGHSHTGTTAGSNQSLDHSHAFQDGRSVPSWQAGWNSWLVAAAGGAGVVPDTPGAGLGSAAYIGTTGGVNGGHAAINHDHAFSTNAVGDHAHVVNSNGTGISTQNTGGGTTHENRPPCRAINFIIRLG